MEFLTLSVFFLIYYYILHYVSKKINLIDYPDKNKKRHLGNIPLIGGPLIFLSLLSLFLFIDFDKFYNLLIFSSSILIIVGILDDIYNFRIDIRILFQLLSTIIILFSGYKIISLGYYPILGEINLGYFSFIFTVLSVLLITNSSNFIDGLDGLCISIPLINSMILNVFIYLYCDCSFFNFTFFYIYTFLLFFILNNLKNPNFKIFLGDSGSTFVGFSFAWILIYYNIQYANIIEPIMIAWLAFFHTFEFIDLIIYRLYNKKSIFKFDRRHIHYLLSDIGLSKINILLTILFFSTSITLLGIVTTIYIGSIYSLILFIILFFVYLYSKKKIMDYVK